MDLDLESAGAVLDEQIELGSVIGRGGMATVFEGFHRGLLCPVAVKVIKISSSSDGDALKRFRHEAQITSSLIHPNIVRLLKLGRERDCLYMVMELVRGKPLSEQVKQYKAERPVRELLGMFSSCCEALKYAHERGVVHRDIKPSNIMLDDSSTGWMPKIADFGIAKLLPEFSDACSKLTRTGDLLGTPLYMSPEQCQGKTVDARTDVYALGCVMYEAFTGKTPFTGINSYDILMQHINQVPQLPSEVNGALASYKGLDNVISRCLCKSPEDRYQSMTELKADIDFVLAGQSLVRKIPSQPIAKSGNRSFNSMRAATSKFLWPVAAVAIVFLGCLIGYVNWPLSGDELLQRAEFEKKTWPFMANAAADYLSFIKAQTPVAFVKLSLPDRTRRFKQLLAAGFEYDDCLNYEKKDPQADIWSNAILCSMIKQDDEQQLMQTLGRASRNMCLRYKDRNGEDTAEHLMVAAGFLGSGAYQLMESGQAGSANIVMGQSFDVLRKAHESAPQALDPILHMEVIARINRIVLVDGLLHHHWKEVHDVANRIARNFYYIREICSSVDRPSVDRQRLEVLTLAKLASRRYGLADQDALSELHKDWKESGSPTIYSLHVLFGCVRTPESALAILQRKTPQQNLYLADYKNALKNDVFGSVVDTDRIYCKALDAAGKELKDPSHYLDAFFFAMIADDYMAFLSKQGENKRREAVNERCVSALRPYMFPQGSKN